MVQFFALIFAAVLLVGCKSNPHKAEAVQTQLDQAEGVSGTQVVGLKKGEMMVLDKTAMSEKLRDLQNTVYGLEDKVYGTRKLNTQGLYGDLKSCRRKLNSRQYGGSGNMVWTEPLDRVTDKEEELKIGLSEKNELVGVSEEYLRDRIMRFQGYKTILQKRSDEFESQIGECKTQLAAKDIDGSQPSKVMVQEVPKSNYDKVAINQFMCSYVKSGASLQNFMINAFAKGWLTLSDYRMEQNLVFASLKDTKGNAKDNALMFGGWKMSFDRGPVTVGELLQAGKDAQLVAWTYDKKDDVQGSGTCLARSEGTWNP